MTSKSVLLLGIVFIFLLNVVAVHNYIDDSYYTSYQSNKSVKKVEKKVIHKEKPIKSVVKKEEKAKVAENITLYKSLRLSSAKEESRYSQKLILKQQKEIEKKNAIKEIVSKPVKNMIIRLDLNINNIYEPNNPIIKKIAREFNKDRLIVIKIYHFNANIKKYIKNIKDDLIENEIDIDDIKVIYNKSEQINKNKIEVFLVKKD